MDNTLKYYAKNTEEFIASTLEADMSATQEKFLALLPKGAHILDLGCGSGRDSLCFLQQGFQVTAVDGSLELAKFASELIGQEVVVSDFKDLVLPVASFDAIWASASLLHVHSKDLPGILAKVIDFAKPGAVFYMSFKYGDYEGERGGRYYTDLNEARFADFLQKSGRSLEIIEQWVAKDVRPDKPELWLNTFARK
ncbi:MAG: class I SAM-dependent methyltransferase [Acholeplasmataceae bacterium]|nr:class I SAM-dependent methyltransferase [Acholeplasmataceae bacterium]